jgi:peroxiredoxin (alkyl hydroperoxide reductase subunit C)
MTNAMPILGEKFPYFTVETTQGTISLPDHYEGKWFVLFSHPADFTPVCTTEFIAFAKKYDTFKKLNIELIGLSVDQVFSHIEWLDKIEKSFNIKIPFPVIADSAEGLSKRLGMIHANNTNTVRAVFIVDPYGILRLSFSYPQEIGRNMDEILRATKAMMVTDTYQVAAPENWPYNSLIGSDLILPPPDSIQKAREAVMEDECFDWWFCYRSWVNNFDEI